MPNEITTAVIIAAGRGIRLGNRGRLMPKGFLQIGERPIIEESVRHLLDHGIRRIVIVTGHLAEFYERLARAYPDRIETIFNPQFANCGSMCSLDCSYPYVDEDFLLLESDLLYEPRALSACLTNPSRSLILLSGPTGSRDEIFVEVENGQLKNMSKTLSDLEGPSHGEFVGVLKMSQELFSMMHTDAAARFQESLHVEYETQCLVTVAQSQSIPCLLVPDLVWSEIDDQHHLDRAHHEIYPRLHAKEGSMLM